jgi:multidrug efflux pump
MALTISTGFVVDDAIVMIENIARYVEQGESPMKAALDGAKQIGFTIISLTFSLVAVLIPLLFMGDITGRLFREFSITLGVSILISAVVSLTLTPMMCARLLKHAPAESEGRFYEATGKAFERVTAWYGRTLRMVLRHQPLVLLIAVGTLLLTVLLYATAPKGLFPLQDTGVITGISEAPQAVSFAAMSERQQALAEVILRDPAVESLSSFIGVDGINTSLNVGRIQILLKAHGQRPSAAKVMERLRQELDKVPGIRLHMQAAQDLSVDMRQGRTAYQYSLDSTDQAMLNLWAPRLEESLRHRPELRSVSSDQQSDGKRIFVHIDRLSASRLGITPQQIDNALYDAFGQRQVSTIFTELNQYRVVLTALPEMRAGPEALASVYMSTGDGKKTPLAAVAAFSEQSGPLVISRQGQFPVVTFGFNAAPGYALGDAVDAVRQASLDTSLPPILQGKFQGTASAFLASLDNQVFLILAALVTVYIVLGVLYESFIHPVTILSTLPSAGVGALIGLRLFGMELDVLAVIGIILLIGIVKKNGIMMVDFALEAERDQDMPPEEAIFQASLLRFRPIMMTTMAALFSAVPLAFGGGVGSELRQPLGVCIIGGLIISQVLTLYTTPVIYLAFDRLAHRFGKNRTP